jgi:hypothetical protein
MRQQRGEFDFGKSPMPRHSMSAHSASWTRSHRRHAHRGAAVSEFEQRAAAAWIRAADAGVIDSTELGWLLDRLPFHTATQTTDDHRPKR